MPDAPMHPSMQRLYEAAKALKATEGQTSVAKLLNDTSPQRLNNWETRGMSKQAAIEAEKIIGCRATWLLYGTGAMAADWPFTSIDPAKLSSLDQPMLKKLEDALLFAGQQLDIDISKLESGKSSPSKRRANG